VTSLDWTVLAASLVFIVVYGVWKGRGTDTMDGYLRAGNEMRWLPVALSIMATQASAITFLSTPGQAYADGMRFVQFYFGLPVAMVILSITAVPLYHRLRVYTAYEYLEGRFDLKTRTLTAFLFLVQRGMAAGLTIFAPAIILSVILKWNLDLTIVFIGALVVIYTAWGGTRAVGWTHLHQMVIILLGMAAAFVVLVLSLPQHVSLLDALRVAGKMGRLNAVDFSFDLSDRYTFWSGLIGGTFLALSYFGTDQSQVQRYLTARSVGASRLGLLFNGLVKVPMQFGILLLGAVVFAFYQFVQPPLFFNPVPVEVARASGASGELATLEDRFGRAFAAKRERAYELLHAIDSGDRRRIATASAELRGAAARQDAVRADAVDVLKAHDPGMDPSDVNYVFLTFVVRYLPTGLLGLVLAAVFAASMSSTASELNALASTTVVDLYRRLGRGAAPEHHYVAASRVATVFWGMFAIGFAVSAGRLGSLVEAVNILGSLFYGTILGVFLVAFFVRGVRGTPVFLAALSAEAGVISCFLFTHIPYLWFNVLGCIAVIVLALALEKLMPARPTATLQGA
jgi:SSS family solute:Na+ symporter